MDIVMIMNMPSLMIQAQVSWFTYDMHNIYKSFTLAKQQLNLSNLSSIGLGTSLRPSIDFAGVQERPFVLYYHVHLCV